MKRWLLPILLLLFGYLATGFYVVRGNEKAVVRRFGRVLRNAAGSPALRGSGLHFDLPVPFVRIDRVNLNEVRTLTVGVSESDVVPDSQFLQSVTAAETSRFLTGDKNILNIKFGIQYRVSEAQIDAYLFATTDPERRLQVMAEGVLSNLVTQSGVDFVHTHGRALLQQLFTERLRTLCEQQRLGIAVDTVTLEKIEPPLRVRAAFLDVNDARADKRKYVNSAAAYAAERREAARADEQEIRNEAEVYRQQTIEQAKAEAESFLKLVDQFDRAESQPNGSRAAARRIAMQRFYLQSMESILRRVKGKVILESGKPIDLTIMRNPRE